MLAMKDSAIDGDIGASLFFNGICKYFVSKFEDSTKLVVRVKDCNGVELLVSLGSLKKIINKAMTTPGIPVMM